ncbi:MAG: GLPGLI family protein, partial [Chryseobacterium sp.]|nr:GLPGLI family protein [Chryseobacterium sp.]
KDSTQIANVAEETYYLDTFKGGSVFYSYDNFKQDSLAKSYGDSWFNVSDRVFKTYPKYNVTLISKIEQDLFEVKDDRQIIWKISSETIQIGVWKSQKATGNFAGRQWTAWFSTEIPIQDGPYKFHGLPGLITKIRDETKSHIFVLRSILKLKNSELNALTTYKKPIVISREKYITLFKDYRNDPIKNWRQKGVVKSKEDLSPDNELLKKISDSKMKQIGADNNILEIDLLKP